jgi:hypothetical protein
MPLEFAPWRNVEGEMKLKLLAAAALVTLSLPALAADVNVSVRHHRHHARHAREAAVIISYIHNYGPADFYPGTTAPPDRVVFPLNERPYGIYDGFDRHCGQSTANYRGQDGRRYACN